MRIYVFQIGAKKMMVDGFDAPSHTVFQFSGCLYHGHECMEDNGPKAKRMRLKEEQLCLKRESILKRTMESFDYVTKTCGYRLDHIWECTWNRLKKEDPAVRSFMTKSRVRSDHDQRQNAMRVLPK